MQLFLPKQLRHSLNNADNIVEINCQLINIKSWANNLVSFYTPNPKWGIPVWEDVVKRPIYDILRSFEGQGKITDVFPIISDLKTVFEIYPGEKKSRTALDASATFDFIAGSVASVGDIFKVNPISSVGELAGDFVVPMVSKEGNINTIGHEILKCDIVIVVGEVLPVVNAATNGEKISVDEIKTAVESIKKDADSIANAGDSYQKSYKASIKKSGLTGGEIAGIVFGVIVGVAAIVGIVVFFVLRSKNKINNKDQDEKEQSP